MDKCTWVAFKREGLRGESGIVSALRRLTTEQNTQKDPITRQTPERHTWGTTGILRQEPSASWGGGIGLDGRTHERQEGKNMT